MNRFEVVMAFAEEHGPFVQGDLTRAHPDLICPSATLTKMVRQGYLAMVPVERYGRYVRRFSLAADDSRCSSLPEDGTGAEMQAGHVPGRYDGPADPEVHG